MGSSKRGADNNRSLGGRAQTARQRLNDAINLGTRSLEKHGRKWQCTDIEIQRHVVHSISAFLDSVSGDARHHPLVKDSVADMVGAVAWILRCKNVNVLSMAADVTMKLVSIVPNSVLQSYLLDLVNPLSSLLPSHQIEVSISCATALNHILLNLSIKHEQVVWEILKKTDSVSHVICNILDSFGGTRPAENFHQMATFLSTVLQCWHQSRFLVWSNSELMKALNNMLIDVEQDSHARMDILKLFSAIALCGNGTRKLLDNGEALVELMLQCMDRSQPHSVRKEGFRLAQCLTINEQKFFKLISSCCEPFVKAIVCGMNNWSLNSGKVAGDKISLLVEACHLALITYWAGKHHKYFWKQGIDKVLLDLLLENSHSKLHQPFLSSEEQISIARECLNADYLQGLRNYVWDILGWLAIHCEEGFNPEMHGNGKELYIDILITCACLAFLDAIKKCVWQNDVSDSLRSESAARAVLMMLYSPCKYVSSKARDRLSEILNQMGNEYLKYLLQTLNRATSGNNFDALQIVISQMGLTCYCSLPQFQKWVIECGGVKTLLHLLSLCSSSDFYIERLNFSTHLPNAVYKRICCCASMEELESKDILLLYSLLGLVQLIKCSGGIKNNPDVFDAQMTCTIPELVCKLQDICCDKKTSELRWSAAYVLSYFEFYGFPSKLGKRIGKALNDNNQTDTRLILTNGECLSVHGVILAIRCPSLLPLDQASGSSVPGSMEICAKLMEGIRLSAHVDYQILVKLLEYIYLGYLQAGEEHVKKLKILAKHCNLQPLLQMLSRKSPKWGAPYPSFDLSVALGPLGHRFSDVSLEAKATDLLCWACGVCSVSVPHIHAHKVILSTSCDYLQALLNSGMQESHSQTVKVPTSWEAMVKLVEWCYSGELPSPPSGCLWEKMDTEEKLRELKPYVELCWLAEFWFIEEVHEACFKVVVSCLDSTKQLCIKVLQLAADFSLGSLFEVALTLLAPMYRQLCDSGELEELDEDLVDVVRVASVRFSQGAGSHLGSAKRLGR
ncbi:hypothetical protein FNV43_RR21287 [Rhamnella rubrinervis]|uniref:BTB domain-containing protein n=1 Tax=Rhamnella rubrinervis TaxID=2594499 RepID=A0A8K0E322_9ROSA|nr:hypothetical protein FNV43_RR21287 [Rhamnella rubrinervis]